MNDQGRIYLFNFSALLILGGAVLFFFHFWIAPYLFAVGAAGMTLSNLTRSYKELNFREKRIHRLNLMGCIMMIVASVLMFKNRNEWIVCLTIAAIFITYAAFIPTPKDNK